MAICWLASYPRSGNTWVRHLLYEYFAEPAENTRDVANFSPYATQIPPDHPLISPQSPLRFCKTHLVCHPAVHPYLDDAVACIYIVRHPKDVMISAFNYFKMNEAPGAEPPLTPETFSQTWLEHAGAPGWRSGGKMGSYIENVVSWLRKTDWPRLVLKYEDLQADAPQALRQVCQLLNQPVDEERVAQAVENTSFEHLRSLEEKERSQNAFNLTLRCDSPQRFFNHGTCRQSLADFAPELEDAFDERFGPIMAALGYDARPTQRQAS